MQKIVLYEALKTFEEKEWRAFLAYVACPLFNTQKKLSILLQHLHQHKNELESLNSKRLFEVVFPDEKYKVQKLKNVRSWLFQLVKKFWALQDFQDKENLQDLSILKTLRERKLSSLYQSHYKALVKKQPIPQKDLDYYQQHLLIEEHAYFLKLDEVRQTKDELQEMVDCLDVFYVVKKLKWTCEMLNRSRIVNATYQLHLVGEITSLLRQPHSAHLKVPLIQLYEQVYLFLTVEENELPFQNLRLLLEKHVKNIDKQEAISLYSYAQNYCIGKINKGESQYMQELFSIYQQLLQNHLIIENGLLAHPHYKNIVTLGLRLKKYDWTEQFIEEYKGFLQNHIRENAYHFNLATYYYEIGELNKVVELLNRAIFTDIYYEISSKYVLIKVYYDLKEFGLLSYLVLSFDKYVRRNKSLSSINRQGILNFLTVLKRLAKIKEWKLFKDRAFILQQKEKMKILLTKKQPIVNLVWLNQKWTEL